MFIVAVASVSQLTELPSLPLTLLALDFKSSEIDGKSSPAGVSSHLVNPALLCLLLCRLHENCS